MLADLHTVLAGHDYRFLSSASPFLPSWVGVVVGRETEECSGQVE